jgi:hypothetical protein
VQALDLRPSHIDLVEEALGPEPPKRHGCSSLLVALESTWDVPRLRRYPVRRARVGERRGGKGEEADCIVTFMVSDGGRGDKRQGTKRKGKAGQEGRGGQGRVKHLYAIRNMVHGPSRNVHVQTRANETRHESGQGRERQGRERQCSPGQGRAVQGRAGQDRTGERREQKRAGQKKGDKTI